MLSHSCQSCGLDLTHVSAPRDPVYGLPIVVCPECRTAVVRRSDGHRLVPRELARLRTAMVQLAFRLAAWAFVTVVTVLTSVGMMELLRNSRLSFSDLVTMLVGLLPRDERYESWLGDMGHVMLLAWALAAVTAGAYVTAARPHARRDVVAASLAVGCVLVLFGPGLLVGLAEWRGPGQEPLLPHLILKTRQEQRASPLLLSAAAVAPLGIPVGRRVRRIDEALRARRWRRTRARIRKGRRGS